MKWYIDMTNFYLYRNFPAIYGIDSSFSGDTLV